MTKKKEVRLMDCGHAEGTACACMLLLNSPFNDGSKMYSEIADRVAKNRRIINEVSNDK